MPDEGPAQGRWTSGHRVADVEVVAGGGGIGADPRRERGELFGFGTFDARKVDDQTRGQAEAARGAGADAEVAVTMANLESLPLDDLLCLTLYAASMEVPCLDKPMFDALDIIYPQYLVLHALWERTRGRSRCGECECPAEALVARSRMALAELGKLHRRLRDVSAGEWLARAVVRSTMDR